MKTIGLMMLLVGTRLPGTSLKVSDSRPLIDYATAAPFAIGFLETALAIEDSSNGIWR
jgi:hypothetical protein